MQVLDFLHLLVHLYAAATAMYREEGSMGRFRVWRLYERLLGTAWVGQVGQVQAALREPLERQGPPPKGAGPDDPRKMLALVLEDVRGSARRIGYVRYRRERFPVTSTLVESLIKRSNQRVKGTEEFQLEDGVEAILQYRAIYRSEDRRAEAFYAHRPRPRVVGPNRLRFAAQTVMRPKSGGGM